MVEAGRGAVGCRPPSSSDLQLRDKGAERKKVGVTRTVGACVGHVTAPFIGGWATHSQGRVKAQWRGGL